MTSTVLNRWVKCVSSQGNLRGVALEATELAQEAVRMHGYRGTAAKSFAEAALGAMMVASYCKQGEKINLNLTSSGIVKQAIIDAHPEGTFRGYLLLRTPEEQGVLASAGTNDSEQGPWGEGVLSILRTRRMESEQPFIGTVPLLTGHLAKDLTFYWLQSEQVPTAVGLDVRMRGDEVIVASGFLIQAMPGADESEIRKIESQIAGYAGSSAEGSGDPKQILSQLFQNAPFALVEERELTYHCECSRQRVERALALVGVAELSDMLKEDGRASVRCDFCTTNYVLDAAELAELISRSEPKR